MWCAAIGKPGSARLEGTEPKVNPLPGYPQSWAKIEIFPRVFLVFRRPNLITGLSYQGKSLLIFFRQSAFNSLLKVFWFVISRHTASNPITASGRNAYKWCAATGKPGSGAQPNRTALPWWTLDSFFLSWLGTLGYWFSVCYAATLLVHLHYIVYKWCAVRRYSVESQPNRKSTASEMEPTMFVDRPGAVTWVEEVWL